MKYQQLLVFISLIAGTFCAIQVPNKDALEKAAESIKVLINSTRSGKNSKDLPKLATMVRLAFHDCVGKGGCDGCVDTSNPSNAGLEDIIVELKRLHNNNFKGDMSRADFFVLAAWTALDVAPLRKESESFTERSNNVDRKFGREDCLSSPPDSSEEDDTDEKFPSSCSDFKQTTDYFKNEFDMNEDDTIAIMGAHTLGRIHGSDDIESKKKPFKGEWVRGQGCSSRVNNKYFKKMMDDGLTGVKDDALCGWKGKGKFLDSDLSLAYKFKRVDNAGSNEPDCKICGLKEDLKSQNGKCCEHAQGYDKTKAYYNDNMLWLEDFAIAFAKMVDNKDSTEIETVEYIPPTPISTKKPKKPKKPKMPKKPKKPKKSKKPKNPKNDPVARRMENEFNDIKNAIREIEDDLNNF